MGVDRHGGNLEEAARRFGLEPARLLDFSASINPYGPPPGVWEALFREREQITSYPDPAAGRLRSKLAEKLGIGMEHVLATSGAAQGIFLLAHALRPRLVLLTAPGFLEYERAARACGAEVRYLPLEAGGDLALPLSELPAYLKGIDLFFLCQPHNPAGWVLNKEEMAEVLASCRSAGTFLAVDESFLEFVEGWEELSMTRQASSTEGLLVLGSLTKFYALPGLRLGYAVGITSLLKRLEDQRDPWSVGRPAQAAGEAALEDVTFPGESRRQLHKEKAYLQEGLQSLGLITFPAAANFLLVKAGRGWPEASLLHGALGRKGILIRPLGGMVGLSGCHFRLAVLARQENELLLQKLAAVKAGEDGI